MQINNKKGFSCIFVTDTTPMSLFLTTLGEKPFTLLFSINSSYETKNFIDDYSELKKYLELKSNSPDGPLRPIHFFTALNKKIPHSFSGKPKYSDVLKAASNKVKIENPAQLYFCGWKNNPKNHKVSEGNYLKTKEAFGDEIASMSRNKNISSKWTDISNMEKLNELNNIYNRS